MRLAPRVTRAFEIDEERVEQVVERSLLGSSERAQKLLLVRHMGFESSVDGRLPSLGQRDERASPIRRVGPPLQEPCFDHAIQAFGHSTRRQEGRAGKLGGVELVGSARAPQRSQEVEPTGLEVVVRERAAERSVGKLRRSKETSEDSQRRHVQVGKLSAPLREDAIDVIRGTGGHRPKNTLC